MKTKHFLTVLLFVPHLSMAQLTKQDSLWLPFSHLIGTWTGTGEGVDGKGKYERSYQFVNNRQYIEMKNRTVYPPTPENPKGYVHEDFGYVSYDKMRKTFVFRQFHGEGFVNQYIAETLSPDGKIVFVTEAIENIPDGWKARETYTPATNGFEEVFELAEPGKDFQLYSKGFFTKR